MSEVSPGATLTAGHVLSLGCCTNSGVNPMTKAMLIDRLASQFGAQARALPSARARLVWSATYASHFEAMTLLQAPGMGALTQTDQEVDHQTYAD